MTTTSTPIHASTASRWSELSLAEQLANVGSEVERALRARASGNETRLRNAVARALELFDLTAADERWRGPRRREILRAREEFCRTLFGEPHATDADSSRPVVRPSPDESLRRYYLAFAVAARLAARPGGGVGTEH